MSNFTLTYDDLWAYYKQAQEDVQEDILKQLDLKTFLPRVSVQVRYEILRTAPPEIKASIQEITRPNLAVSDYKKQIILMFGGKRK